MYVLIWCDFEPYQDSWGNWQRRDFWQSAWEKRYPHESVYLAGELIETAKDFNVPITWGIFACEPFFEWIDYLKPFYIYTQRINHSITIHPHWLSWNGTQWNREINPPKALVAQPFKILPKLQCLPNFEKFIRSGWQSQSFREGGLLKDYYKTLGFKGVGDIGKFGSRKDYYWENDFLIITYDTDSMPVDKENAETKWKAHFLKAIKEHQSIFHFWFHIHELSAALFSELLQFSINAAREFKEPLIFKTAGELYKCLSQ